MGIAPGTTAFTRTLSGASSTALCRVKAATAPLIAEYTPAVGKPCSAAGEAMWTMTPPPCARIFGSAACVVQKHDFSPTASIPSTVSSSTSSMCS